MATNGSKDYYKPIDFSKPIDKAFLRGKTAIVTGGSSGIGAAVVTSLAECGSFVLIADVNEKDGHGLASSLTAQGHSVAFHYTDVTSFESQVAAFKACLEKSPTSEIDIVIACAGIGTNYMENSSLNEQFPLGSEPVAPPVKVIQVNLVGVYYTMHLACHYFRNSKTDEAEDKHLVLVSSLAGFMQNSLNTDYATSKFGVRGMWKSIRSSTAMFHPGMRTNLVAPCYIETPMTVHEVAGVRALGIPVGDVQDAARGVLRLCCDPEITGRAICIVGNVDSDDEFGSANFDLEDDVRSGDGTRALLDALKRGAFGQAVMDYPNMLEAPKSISP